MLDGGLGKHRGRRFVVFRPWRQPGHVRCRRRRIGMRALRESGMLAIYDCGTTIDEVMRETMILE